MLITRHLHTTKDFLTPNQLRVLTIKVEQNNNSNILVLIATG